MGRYSLALPVSLSTLILHSCLTLASLLCSGSGAAREFIHPRNYVSSNGSCGSVLPPAEKTTLDTCVSRGAARFPESSKIIGFLGCNISVHILCSCLSLSPLILRVKRSQPAAAQRSGSPNSVQTPPAETPKFPAKLDEEENMYRSERNLQNLYSLLILLCTLVSSP